MYPSSPNYSQQLLELRPAKSQYVMKTNNYQLDTELLVDISKKKKSEGHQSINYMKKVLIIYASGALGCNDKLQITRGALKNHLKQNFYFCDYAESVRMNLSLQTLISVPFDNGVRVNYKIHQLSNIQTSINISIEILGEICQVIQRNYDIYDSFIVISGMDTICYLGSSLSFMLENLNKLVICTGGLLPLSQMRNLSVMNLIQSFAIITQAATLNDVIIVNKNKGYRANRSIKISDGDFDSIDSPNLPNIISLKSKLTLKSSLIEPRPTELFSVFYHISDKIKVLKLNFYENIESIEYELNNPHIKGIVIQSYGFANIPNNPELLNLFKKAYQQRGTIFLNISESIKSKNQSLMADFLKQYHINYGADMTTEAAMAKLSYLIGKCYSTSHTIELLAKNLRGELTEKKERTQFHVNQACLMEIVKDVLYEQYPTNLKQQITDKIEKKIIQYIGGQCTTEQFWLIFDKNKFLSEEQSIIACQQNQSKTKVKNVCSFQDFIEKHQILHLLAKKENHTMIKQMLQYTKKVNTLDIHNCSPMFYALQGFNKEIIHQFKKRGGKIICPIQDLFEIMIRHLKTDNVSFFQLLAHLQFKQTLGQITNDEGRNVFHIACLLKAKECYEFIKLKFLIPYQLKDIYQKKAEDYYNSRNISELLTRLQLIVQ